MACAKLYTFCNSDLNGLKNGEHGKGVEAFADDCHHIWVVNICPYLVLLFICIYLHPICKYIDYNESKYFNETFAPHPHFPIEMTCVNLSNSSGFASSLKIFTTAWQKYLNVICYVRNLAKESKQSIIMVVRMLEGYITDVIRCFEGFRGLLIYFSARSLIN